MPRVCARRMNMDSVPEIVGYGGRRKSVYIQPNVLQGLLSNMLHCSASGNAGKYSATGKMAARLINRFSGRTLRKAVRLNTSAGRTNGLPLRGY